MKKRLYIIGNGFDLHHELRTSYWDFSEYLKENDSELYYLLDSYTYYPATEESLWSKFEENLANLEINDILSDNTDRLPDYASDDFRDRDRHVFPDVMDGYHSKLTIGLLEIFKRFIQDVEVPKKAFGYKIELDKSASFLSFNYTDTLQRLYNIDKDKIVYLHNSAFESDDVILGHGTDPKKFEEKKPLPPDGLTEEQLEQWHDEHDDWDYSYDTGKVTIMRYYRDTFKPTNEVINNHSSFFEKIGDAPRVHSIGKNAASLESKI